MTEESNVEEKTNGVRIPAHKLASGALVGTKWLEDHKAFAVMLRNPEGEDTQFLLTKEAAGILGLLLLQDLSYASDGKQYFAFLSTLDGLKHTLKGDIDSSKFVVSPVACL